MRKIYSLSEVYKFCNAVREFRPEIFFEDFEDPHFINIGTDEDPIEELVGYDYFCKFGIDGHFYSFWFSYQYIGSRQVIDRNNSSFQLTNADEDFLITIRWHKNKMYYWRYDEHIEMGQDPFHSIKKFNLESKLKKSLTKKNEITMRKRKV